MTDSEDTMGAEAGPALDEAVRPGGAALEVLAVAMRLGLTSFGGPVAHLGYFREEYVNRRRWVDEPTYADVVALCQFPPGPASSQVGITLGIARAGLVIGALPFWDTLRRRPGFQASLRGINAAVVGLLLAALCQPVWTSAIGGPVDFGLALVVLGLLALWKLPPWLVVLLAAGGGAVLSALG